MTISTFLRIGWAVIVSILGISCGPPKGINGPRITSVANLHDIGLAIKSYREENDEWPSKLSALVPRYIPYSGTGVFFVTNKYARQPLIPTDLKGHLDSIDQYSSYVYLGTNSVHAIVAFERTNLWKSSAPQMEGKVAVLYSDGRVEMVPLPSLQALLK